MGFVVDKVALGQVFSEFFGIPVSLSFHPGSAYLFTEKGGDIYSIGSGRLTSVYLI
jgi:hypothetical protein